MNKIMTPDEWDEVIAELRSGWQKGDYGPYMRSEGGKLCFVGALRRVAIRHGVRRDRVTASMLVNNAAHLAWAIACEMYPDRVPYYDDIMEFNDDDVTQLSDVILVCEKARARASEFA